MFRKLIATSSTWFTVPVRAALAAVFIAHGSQKVLGSFNGPGFKAFTSGNTPLSFMRPAWLWLAAAAFSEFFGGILVALGFLTRVGAFLIACVMITAIAGVHWPGGFFANNRGFEYPMSLLAIAIALLIAGGGQLSVDKSVSGGRRYVDRPRLIVIFTTVFIDLVGFGIVIPVLPFYAEGTIFNATPRTVGLLFASYSVLPLIFPPVLGGLSDKYGRRPVLFLSIIGTGIGFLVLGLATTLWMLFAGQIGR